MLASVLACLILWPSTVLAESPKRIVVAHSASWTPYAFLSESGVPSGLLIDLWQLFGEKNDVEIVFELVDWRTTLELVRSGEADVHGGLTVSDGRDAFLDFSREVLRIRTLLFVPSTSDDQELADMADRTVGVIASSFDQDFIETHFPLVSLRPFASSEAMIDAALRGEVHAFVADYPSGYYRLLLAGAIGSFRAVDTLYTESIHVAVKQDANALLAFLDAGFDKITEAEKNRIRDRWFIPPEPMPRWVLPVGVAAGVTLSVIAFLVHYLSLRATVRRRTHELSVSIGELEVANRDLQLLTRVDSLTGAANRRAFYDMAAQEIERVKRYARPLSLVLFDLDHFKQVNDRFGHLAGDAVLKGFVDVVGATLREADVFARLGGDEFAALLPETADDEAVIMAQRILEAIRARGFQQAGQIIDVSFSAGVAEFAGDATIDDWIKRADTQLYRSKAEGRAQVAGSQR